jgi:hypothetical protein
MQVCHVMRLSAMRAFSGQKRWPPASQDYDERTVQVPSQTYGKLSGMCGPL